MTVSSTVARNIDTCNGVTTVRTIPYKLLDATHVNVYRYTIATGAVSAPLTLNVDYTIQNVGADNAQYTMASADSSAFKLINIRNVPFSQAADYVQNDSFPAETHEAALDKLTMIAQQMQDTMKRAASLPLFADPALAVTLPIPVDGYGLIWSGTGGTIVNTSVSMADLQAQAALLAGIAGDITTVASISGNVVSVDGNAANINTVAGLSAKITTLAAISTAITGVNAIAASVSTVAGISGNVTTVAGISAAVTTVAGISAAVSTVSGISANVTTVAGVSAGITTLSPIATNITTVAGISANVTTVAGIAANVTTVAGIQAAVTTVAGISAAVSAINSDLTNINAVAADLTNIDTCAANLAAINAAPGYASAAAASAAAAAASASGISMRGSCRVASTTALTVTYANGTLGVGATLTNAGSQAAISIDGVSLAVNDRVLVKDQGSAFQNGIYFVTVVGTGATNWVLTRATDYDQSAEIVEGTATIVEEGTTNASHIYVMTHNGAITVGTTAIDWTSLTANATSANTLTTPQAIYGNNFDGSAALTQIIASTYGGTGNGFTKFSGPTTSEKTFTLPNSNATLLYSGGDAGTPSALVGTNISGTAASLTAGNATKLATARAINGVNFDGSAAITVGDYNFPRTVQTTTYAPTTTDNGSLISFVGAAANATWTIAAGATNGAGWNCIFYNPTLFFLTIKVTTNTIDGIAGATGFIMYPGEMRMVQCDGTNYYTTILKGFWINTTSTFTFTVPPGYQAFDCEIWGGGAGGGTGSASSGGGGGGYNCSTITAATMGSTTQTVTVGAAGSAGAPPTVGGETSIGSLLTAFGGGIGVSSTSNCGGGGGGSPTAVGGNASGSTGGTGGGNQGNTLTGAGGASSVNGTDGMGGGGGGGGAGGTGGSSFGFGGGGGGSNASVGGNAIWGGGGGGGTSAAGGKSIYGGNGGTGGGAAGVTPAGGGGRNAAGGSGQVWIRGVV